MLIRRSAALFVLPVLGLIAPIVACGSNSTDAAGGGGTGPEDGGTSNADGNTNHPAKGDPCRGEPLPDAEHFVASGLCARLVSASIPKIRQIMFAPNGDLFGQSDNGKIWLYRDDDEDGFFTKAEIREWATTGSNGNNAHVDAAGGYVYAGFDTGVKRFAYDPAATKGGPAEDVVVNVPAGGHSKHTTHVFDGFLYVHSGSAGNATHETDSKTEYDTKRSLIKRFDLSKLTPGTPFNWDDGEAFTVGLRNANGFARNESTKKIYTVVNGLDNQSYDGNDVHLDNPGEQIAELAAGKKYGYPFCFTAQRVVKGGNVVAPGTQLWNMAYGGGTLAAGDAWCAANSSPPTTFVQAHSAPLDITFFDKQAQGALPEKWRGGAFVAFHGSWNREGQQTGYKVVWQPFNADGTAPLPTSTDKTTTFPYEVVFGGGSVTGGPVDKSWSWSSDTGGEQVRPAGVAVSPIDGALYVASDQGGFVYRIGMKAN
ncbi:MAG: L-sorbosone dehydrogenase [Labilithrix sp.]|nr:L-sorbosone dehydrogenase [Labilithrix sp.]